MASATVRVDDETLSKLRSLANASGEAMPTILRQAVDAYERAQFLEGLNRDFAALRSDPEAWAQEQKERKEWEATLMDGLAKD
ncbi:MAG: toxin-antitoxin system protein [Planctomycetota bacterium]|nr:MAG: toxin-antitoxin system protein [Planctomycetota bacterium]